MISSSTHLQYRHILFTSPGDENDQVPVCLTGFDGPDPQQQQQQQSLNQQLSCPIQVSEPFPAQDGAMYFPPPDISSYLAPGGGTPRSRLPLNSFNTQQSYPPDKTSTPSQKRGNNSNNGGGAVPPPPPRVIGVSHHPPARAPWPSRWPFGRRYRPQRSRCDRARPCGRG